MKERLIRVNEVWSIEVAPCRKCKKVRVRGKFGYCKKCAAQIRGEELNIPFPPGHRL